jgi:Rad3-related DNA helicase
VAVQGVLERHEEESVLVHSHSYELTKLIAEALQTSSSRPVLTYLKAKDKDDAVHEFRRMEGDAPVLVAPSLGRGVDLPDDLCRVVVVAKIPYASLGDKQISARLHDTEDGQLWYTLQAMRELVQMTGRGVRSKSDWCVSYVLDEGMVQILKKTQWLLPDWWCDAMATPFSPTDLLMHANGHSSDSL